MKKIVSLILSFVMILSSIFIVNITAFAEIVSDGCGDGSEGNTVSYTYDLETGICTVSGIGATFSYDPQAKMAHWHKNWISDKRGYDGSHWIGPAQMKEMRILDGVTKIGDCFTRSMEVNNGYSLSYGLCNLEKVVIGQSVSSIGSYAFYNCGKLSKYSGTQLAGKTITVAGSKVTIRLTSDGSSGFYGFSVDSITAKMIGGSYIADTTALPESSHNYENSANQSFTYVSNVPNAQSLAVKFSAKTFTEANYDFIYIYDGNNNLIGKYSGKELASKTIIIPTATFTIKLTSDGSSSGYGFSIDNIVAYTATDYCI